MATLVIFHKILQLTLYTLLWLNSVVHFAPTCYSISLREAEKSTLLMEL